MDGFSLQVLGDLGPTGLLTLVVLLVLFGKLVPSRQVDKDERRTTAALDRGDEVIKIQAQTILELTVAANNSLNVVNSRSPAVPQSPALPLPPEPADGGQ